MKGFTINKRKILKEVIKKTKNSPVEYLEKGEYLIETNKFNVVLENYRGLGPLEEEVYSIRIIDLETDTSIQFDSEYKINRDYKGKEMQSIYDTLKRLYEDSKKRIIS